jgi:hypothetical protein
MNIFVKRILGIGLFGAIASVGALQAQQQAKFHLPFTATWNKVVLPPGDYTLSVPGLAVSPRGFLLNGPDTKAFILPMSAGAGTYAAADDTHSYLKLVNVDGTYYVESYESGPTSTEFGFKTPKPRIRLQMSKREVVTVGVAGE